MYTLPPSFVDIYQLRTLDSTCSRSESHLRSQVIVANCHTAKRMNIHQYYSLTILSFGDYCILAERMFLQLS